MFFVEFFEAVEEFFQNRDRFIRLERLKMKKEIRFCLEILCRGCIRFTIFLSFSSNQISKTKKVKACQGTDSSMESIKHEHSKYHELKSISHQTVLVEKNKIIKKSSILSFLSSRSVKNGSGMSFSFRLMYSDHTFIELS